MSNSILSCGISKSRFSLASLLVAVAAMALMMAWVNRMTFTHLGQSTYATHWVPADPNIVAPELHDWMLRIGFSEATVMPLRQSIDTTRVTETRFYKGCFGGPVPFFVTITPNWAGDQTPDAPPTSNVLVQCVIDYRGRFWRARRAAGAIAEFMKRFHARCDEYGPEPGSR